MCPPLIDPVTPARRAFTPGCGREATHCRGERQRPGRAVRPITGRTAAGCPELQHAQFDPDRSGICGRRLASPDLSLEPGHHACRAQPRHRHHGRRRRGQGLVRSRRWPAWMPAPMALPTSTAGPRPGRARAGGSRHGSTISPVPSRRLERSSGAPCGRRCSKPWPPGAAGEADAAPAGVAD